MLRPYFIFLFPLFLFLQLSCSVVRYADIEGGPDRSTGDLRFFADFAIFQTEHDSVRVDLYLKFPNAMLSFSRRDSEFVAHYEGTITVNREGGKRIVTEEFEGRIHENSYEKAHSINTCEFRSFHFQLKPGRYAFTVTLHDVNSQRRGMVHRELGIVSFPKNAISISSIVFAERIEEDIPQTFNIVPNPERIYGEHLPELRFYCEVYIPEHFEDRENLQTQFEFVSWKNENRIVVEEGETISTEQGKHALAGTILLPGIKEEDIELVIHVTDREGNSLARRKGLFHVYWPLLNWGDDFELSLAQLELVASDEVITEYKILTPEERESFLHAYWKSRDPVPQTEQNELMMEFEKRLRHAKNHLGGIWTDRGKVYVQNGPPQEMTRRMVRDAFGYIRPAEIWIYYDPYREFIFVDNRLIRR